MGAFSSKKPPTGGGFLFALRVAGPGIAPGSRGYEPLEVLLLYPAISSLYGLAYQIIDTSQSPRCSKILEILGCTYRSRAQLRSLEKCNRLLGAPSGYEFCALPMLC
jgi:hypothetical protein